MKTRMLLTAALVGAASLSALSAQAGVHFGFSFGLPLPPLPVFVVSRPAPVYVEAPAAPVYVTAPACPAPVAVVETPACPGPDYVWAPGYWSFNGPSRVWVAGCWNYRPTHVVYGHAYGYDRGYDRGNGNDRGWAGHDRDGHDHDGYRR